MNTAASIDQMLVAVGPEEDAILSIVRREASEWTLRYADTDVQVELDEATGRLSLFCALSSPREEDRLRFFALFLRYNLLVRETGGVLFALNDQIPVLMVDLGSAPIDRDTFGIVLRNFVTKVRLWQEALLESPQTAAAPDASESGFTIRI